MEIIKKNKKLFLKTILFISLLLFGFVFALSNIANDNVNRQEHRKVISEEIQKNKHEAWQGTAVPNTGYVEKVYFNINLSVEEVVDLIVSNNMLENSAYYFLAIDTEYFIRLVYDSIDDYYTIKAGDEYIFISEYIELIGNDYIGWNPTFNGVISINNNVVDNLYNGVFNVGNNNNNLSSLFSTTPFVETNETTIIEIIGNGIADAAIKFGDVITFGFGSIKNIILNEDNTLTYTGSVVVVLVSAAIISFAFRLLLKVFGFIRVG